MRYLKTYKQLNETLRSYKIDVVVKKLSNLFKKYGLEDKDENFDAEKRFWIHHDRKSLKKNLEEYKDVNHPTTKFMLDKGYSQQYLIDNYQAMLDDMEYGDIYITTTWNSPELTKELLHLIDSSGYFIALAKDGEKKHGVGEIKDKNKIKEILPTIDHIFMSIEPMYDKEIDFKDEYLYHTTDSKNLEKIMKSGLIPKSKNTRSFYPDRIYLSPNIKYMDTIRNQLQGDKGGEYVNLRIKNKGYKLYKDVRFPGGFYTYDNIHPDDIEVI